MLNLQAKPVELNIFWTATVLAIAAMFAGFMLEEPLFFLVPVGFLFAYQLIINYKIIFFIKIIKTPCLIYGFKKINTLKNEIPKKSL